MSGGLERRLTSVQNRAREEQVVMLVAVFIFVQHVHAHPAFTRPLLLA
jgi:hypothetical protein